jgi:hypothetical protein
MSRSVMATQRAIGAHRASAPGLSCCRRAILFVGPAHHDPERVIRQWPLQRLGFIPRRANRPALFI